MDFVINLLDQLQYIVLKIPIIWFVVVVVVFCVFDFSWVYKK